MVILSGGITAYGVGLVLVLVFDGANFNLVLVAKEGLRWVEAFELAAFVFGDFGPDAIGFGSAASMSGRTGRYVVSAVRILVSLSVWSSKRFSRRRIENMLCIKSSKYL